MWSFMSFKLLKKYSHSKTESEIEEDNKLKSLSCHVRHNMETTLHINDYKFHKPGKTRNNKN